MDDRNRTFYPADSYIWWTLEINCSGIIIGLWEHTALKGIRIDHICGFGWGDQFLLRVRQCSTSAATHEQAKVFLKGLVPQENKVTPCTKKDKALRKAARALDAWLHFYAPELCDDELLHQSQRVVSQGVLGFIADTQEEIREALDSKDGEN